MTFPHHRFAMLGLLLWTNALAAAEPKPLTNVARLTVTSPAFEHEGRLPNQYTCDGKGVSPPIQWSGAPAGTKCFAVSLWHTASDREKSYWLVYDIPADVTKLAENEQSVGRMGMNDKRRAAYEPMCPKGTKLNTYNITVFALSARPKLLAEGVNRAALLEAIHGIKLAEGTLSFRHQRKQE